MMNCIEYQNGCSPSELGHFAYAIEDLNNFRLPLTKMTVVHASYARIPVAQLVRASDCYSEEQSSDPGWISVSF